MPPQSQLPHNKSHPALPLPDALSAKLTRLGSGTPVRRSTLTRTLRQPPSHELRTGSDTDATLVIDAIYADHRNRQALLSVLALLRDHDSPEANG